MCNDEISKLFKKAEIWCVAFLGTPKNVSHYLFCPRAPRGSGQISIQLKSKMSNFKKLIVQHCSPGPDEPIDSLNYAQKLFGAEILGSKVSKLQ